MGLTPSSNLSSAGASASSSNASTPGASCSSGVNAQNLLSGQMNAPQTTGAGSQQQQTSSSGSSGQVNPSGMPSPADLSLMLSLGLGLNPADASQLANLDFNKLAHYLVSNVLLIVFYLLFFYR